VKAPGVPMLGCNEHTSPTRWKGTLAHPQLTVLQMGALWILKRGGVHYPKAHKEQGRGAHEDENKNSEK